MSNELEGRQWFFKQVRRLFIALAIITLLGSYESIVELILKGLGL